eukprot:6832641-Pyramimonas_sp.AAC.1
MATEELPGGPRRPRVHRENIAPNGRIWTVRWNDRSCAARVEVVTGDSNAPAEVVTGRRPARHTES